MGFNMLWDGLYWSFQGRKSGSLSSAEALRCHLPGPFGASFWRSLRKSLALPLTFQLSLDTCEALQLKTLDAPWLQDPNFLSFFTKGLTHRINF
jgi:hypothetical protein